MTISLSTDERFASLDLSKEECGAVEHRGLLGLRFRVKGAAGAALLLRTKSGSASTSSPAVAVRENQRPAGATILRRYQPATLSGVAGLRFCPCRAGDGGQGAVLPPFRGCVSRPLEN